MLNSLLPTVIIGNYGAKLDSKGRIIVMVLTAITRPGKYFGIPQWSQTAGTNIEDFLMDEFRSRLYK